MRMLVAAVVAVLVAPPAFAGDGPSPEDRTAVADCVGLAKQKADSAPTTETSVDPGAEAQLERAARDAPTSAESCIGVIASPCQETPDGSSNLGMAQCLDRETAVWDEQLNANYKARLADASPDYRDALKKMQRAWIAYRDAKCESIGPEMDGSMSIPMTASCMLTETARQAIFLEPQ